MLEFLVGGFIGLVVLCLALMFLVTVPFMLLGLVLRGLFMVLLLPFRLLGMAFGVIGMALGALFKGAFALVSVVGGILMVVLLVVLFPLGLIVLACIALWGLFRLLSPRTAVRAV
jgi:hypothetical protein